MKPPLADQLRPKTLEEIVGQDHLLQENGLIRRIIASGRPLSLILWGPPGCGKTTLARLYAKAFEARFVPLSAVFSGIAELKKILRDAEATPLIPTILFVDEIHRFNKAQQDAFLPHLERGAITLIGATTENPSFALNDALLSRVRVLTLHPLSDEALEAILQRCQVTLTSEARSALLRLAQGDGRYLLNLVENLSSEESVDLSDLERLIQRRAPLYDKHDESHFNLISALHKSVRGSDPDASLYWLARMLDGGEDPLYLARRLIRMASEDIGLADPQALHITLSARDAYQMLGSPEGELALAQATLYLALAPKSNAAYTAYKSARDLAAKTSHLSPPLHILNAPTSLMKSLDYGKDYIYDHDMPTAFSGQNYFPADLPRPTLYTPVPRGFEREMSKRLAYFQKLRSNAG